MVLYTAREMLNIGLVDIARISNVRLRFMRDPTKFRKFKSHFGIHPLHAAKVWRDLQSNDVPVEARVNPDKANIKAFFAGLNLMKVYASDDVRADFMNMGVNSCRDLAWEYTKKIAGLKAYKIIWPQMFDTVFTVTIDGTHCRINEPRDPHMRKNPRWYSHKDHHAGLNYELAISIFENKVVHCSTQTKASVHDITTFRRELKGKLESLPHSCRAIADNAYISDDVNHIISAYNQFDSKEVKEFKRRAKARHESFNARLKRFNCLDQRFHQPDRAKHQICFEAVVVLCQYAIEDTSAYGEPLFDV